MRLSYSYSLNGFYWTRRDGLKSQVFETGDLARKALADGKCLWGRDCLALTGSPKGRLGRAYVIPVPFGVVHHELEL